MHRSWWISGGPTTKLLFKQLGGLHQGKLGGPLLDRIELHIEVPAVPATQLLDTPAGEASAEVRAREAEARERAVRRQGNANQALQGAEIDRHAQLDAAASWPARSRI